MQYAPVCSSDHQISFHLAHRYVHFLLLPIFTLTQSIYKMPMPVLSDYNFINEKISAWRRCFEEDVQTLTEQMQRIHELYPNSDVAQRLVNEVASLNSWLHNITERCTNLLSQIRNQNVLLSVGERCMQYLDGCKLRLHNLIVRFSDPRFVNEGFLDARSLWSPGEEPEE